MFVRNGFEVNMPKPFGPEDISPQTQPVVKIADDLTQSP
jgi:hypothetical protein